MSAQRPLRHCWERPRQCSCLHRDPSGIAGRGRGSAHICTETPPALLGEAEAVLISAQRPLRHCWERPRQCSYLHRDPSGIAGRGRGSAHICTETPPALLGEAEAVLISAQRPLRHCWERPRQCSYLHRDPSGIAGRGRGSAHICTETPPALLGEAEAVLISAQRPLRHCWERPRQCSYLHRDPSGIADGPPSASGKKPRRGGMGETWACSDWPPLLRSPYQYTPNKLCHIPTCCGCYNLHQNNSKQCCSFTQKLCFFMYSRGPPWHPQGCSHLLLKTAVLKLPLKPRAVLGHLDSSLATPPCGLASPNPHPPFHTQPDIAVPVRKGFACSLWVPSFSRCGLILR
ncbi:uncharacterized protein LOC115894346 [Rhinopithecus roxellana]|uniref:uncharacterized protein LOC115894346 n=1 Tax=Rhinopithecus roxellana TaxID=61622 RepID=UPI0012375936|nr:uncharacterized protein LOC115894346 [Rhinopithecus roxellana]